MRNTNTTKLWLMALITVVLLVFTGCATNEHPKDFLSDGDNIDNNDNDTATETDGDLDGADGDKDSAENETEIDGDNETDDSENADGDTDGTTEVDGDNEADTSETDGDQTDGDNDSVDNVPKFVLTIYSAGDSRQTARVRRPGSTRVETHILARPQMDIPFFEGEERSMVAILRNDSDSTPPPVGVIVTPYQDFLVNPYWRDGANLSVDCSAHYETYRRIGTDENPMIIQPTDILILMASLQDFGCGTVDGDIDTDNDTTDSDTADNDTTDSDTADGDTDTDQDTSDNDTSDGDSDNPNLCRVMTITSSTGNQTLSTLYAGERFMEQFPLEAGIPWTHKFCKYDMLIIARSGTTTGEPYPLVGATSDTGLLFYVNVNYRGRIDFVEVDTDPLHYESFTSLGTSSHPEMFNREGMMIIFAPPEDLRSGK